MRAFKEERHVQRLEEARAANRKLAAEAKEKAELRNNRVLTLILTPGPLILTTGLTLNLSRS